MGGIPCQTEGREMKRLVVFFSLISFFLVSLCSAQDKSSYLIGPSDVLEIIVWKEPDFSREVIVRPDGCITLPLINDVLAAGKTPVQLKEELEKKLAEYIDLPVVTVIVKGMSSKRYYIIGEIVNPGEYPLTKPMTILQALSVAGGFTEWAKKDKVKVIRTENGKREVLIFNYENAAKGKEINDFYLKADDIILVP
jgi:polysaccharide export outer membrane protein